MVADDQMLLCSGQLSEDHLEPVLVFCRRSERKVTNDVERVVGLHDLPHVFDQDGVHVVCCAEGTARERDDVLMPKMGIGCVPDCHIVDLCVRRHSWGEAKNAASIGRVSIEFIVKEVT